jgi:hypothetical protein
LCWLWLALALYYDERRKNNDVEKIWRQRSDAFCINRSILIDEDERYAKRHKDIEKFQCLDQIEKKSQEQKKEHWDEKQRWDLAAKTKELTIVIEYWSLIDLIW